MTKPGTRPVVRRGAGLIFVIGVLLMWASPAQAHDYLASSTPAKDTVFTEPLEKVSLTFNETPLQGLETTSHIEMTAADGAQVISGEVTVEGATLSAPVQMKQPGPYTVVWQTVSSDGHPISGSYSFTWQPAVIEPSGAPASASPTMPPTSEAPSSTPSPSTEPSSDTQPVESLPAMVTVALIVVVLGLVSVFVVRFFKRRRSGGTTQP